MGQYDIYAMPGNSTETDGFLGLFGYVNVVSDGIFFPVFTFVAWLIMFIVGTRISSPAKALTFSSFMAMILSMPLAVLGLIAPKIMYLFIILLAGGILWAKQEG